MELTKITQVCYMPVKTTSFSPTVIVVDRKSLYLELSEAQIFKLKQLSLVYLAERSNVHYDLIMIRPNFLIRSQLLSYSAMFEVLCIPPQEVRKLEELIIESIYSVND